MKFITWLLLLALLFAVFKVDRTARKKRPVADRFFIIRMSLLTAFVAGATVVAFLVLPNKERILLLVPVAAVAAALANLWRTGRARLRKAQAAVDALAGAKRLN